jgi:hypothetical protein
VRQLHPDDDTHAPEDGSETVEIVRAPMRREVALDVGLSDGTYTVELEPGRALIVGSMVRKGSRVQSSPWAPFRLTALAYGKPESR